MLDTPVRCVEPVAEDHTIEVAGRSIDVSSPDKVFFAERAETKLEHVVP